ncbi:hypothetical protein F4809DRAFT_638112 [Biscogniauxia mediterranea]|nr:hypothetical protein F4809DRAFT_638112 [Biscogniauxia mediterranea]
MADPQPPITIAPDHDHDNAMPPPQPTTSSHETAPMKCCCGSLECVFLKHNQAVLDNVEKDVHTAARMGQALLARHEAYMADAERDRYELTARIEQLEMDNKELEARNARTIEENRDLLDQLELLNSTINDSEGRIKSLEATLLSSQQTVRRLEGETARAEALERQLMSLEQEQAELQSTLILSQEEARSAMFRWKRAERGINDLQEQLERMEKEAKEEREHHEEMINRIERQREMEKELNTAAGRLKGAAAAKSLNHGNGNGRNTVVGHFVRDLLQDNANLQHGIAELREMLMNSNDEIQALRDQLMYHQPLGDGEVNATQTLRSELEPKDPPNDQQQSSKVSQELHIHHHYHVATPKQDPKKPRKKRLGITPIGGGFVPLGTSVPNAASGVMVRHQPAHHSKRESQRSNRWSGSVYSEQPSEFAPSSVPSSPQSHRRNSLFDHTIDTSFPTSPATTVDPMSPGWPCNHRRQPSNLSTRSFQIPSNLALPPTVPPQAHAIIEESDDVEDTPGNSGAESSAEEEELTGQFSVIHDDTAEDDEPTGLPAFRIRRTISHESVVSLSGGLDIHTLKSRPSQLTIGHVSSAASVTGSSTVTARPMLSRDSARRSSVVLRDNFDVYAAQATGSQRALSNLNSRSETSKFGKWVVSWRPWGGGGGGNGSSASGGENNNAGRTPAKSDKEKEVQKIRSRPPGVNQPGVIPGFSEFIAAARSRGPPCNTSPQVVDGEALREGLAE